LSSAAPWWRARRGGTLTIHGGRPLRGTYPISGAKNAVLPLMVATLLTRNLVTLRNVPANLDVAVLAALLQRIGVKLHWSRTEHGMSMTACADEIHPVRVDGDLVARMRASILLLGALLGRCGEATLPMPGGDAIGLRGVDFHVSGLRAMGADIATEGGMIRATARSGLKGADIALPLPSVGATENLLLAAVLAKGTTTIRNAAREPEVADLALCLTSMGATISGAGTDVLTIVGSGMPGGAIHEVLPDRIELGTMACAAAITNGELFLRNGRIGLLGAAAPLLIAAGLNLREVDGGVIASRSATGLTSFDIITKPYPGVATDLQAPAMALASFAPGASTITETIFEQRFRHVDELRKMGANIKLRGQTAFIRGQPDLRGAAVTGTDVRAAAALVIAGLGSVGQTIIAGLDHLDRGYDRMGEKLIACGADIREAHDGSD
jgi:UDP-N-acetylglucosamine 1-carboxyvinyltransferase